MLRRLSPVQPDSFEFTSANLEWAQAQMTKYPEGRQQSAIIPVLWRAQEQEGWLSRPAIEYCANLLGMPYIRALEVATFYFMFQLQPVGSIANIQICGTTSCMICGAEALIEVCKRKIAPAPHTVSADGKFSWEEVECLGACSNAPMAQIGKDYYEDLTPEKLEQLIDALSDGKVPLPGPQNGRFASEPVTGLTSLTEVAGNDLNASAALAREIGETVKRIDGTEVPILTKWLNRDRPAKAADQKEGRDGVPEDEPRPADGKPADKTGVTEQAATADSAAKPDETAPETRRPQGLDAARGDKADDLKLIKGVGPKLEGLLNSLGFWHFDQIAAWGPEELAWVDDNLEGFHGRASRDEWVAQAKILAEGGETEFSKRAEGGNRSDEE
ncbi:NADH-quinone oxidoreductase subunit E [Paracoccus fistulariae]|uniref:NADH-quinone oxidoreductase subunit E n=1 Tax=Paracoccus fistulariae TaxID=658446 RepID=A0ABY7SK37_9RHOB|nr:NADH-quinone oxidoreductase subunit E [Paracoccus fistulariae]MDB6181329.1 NADH-quinone oxidoreductase subunit E [Paracoccus fistulariae]WCR07378.1 NADH-quinone oxidoreductase subunit E [Paracoccus fistulariae]